MKRVGFLIFNQMLSILSRVYVYVAVVVVVVVVVVIYLIKNLCCCCYCYLSYQGSMWLLVLLLVYIYVLTCLFSISINSFRDQKTIMMNGSLFTSWIIQSSPGFKTLLITTHNSLLICGQIEKIFHGDSSLRKCKSP